MKQFWLLLLAFVLPLQMSWAAVHFCSDDVAVAVAAQVADRAVGGHAHADPEDAADPVSAAASQIAQACCGAAHGCHGLHSPMAQSQPLVHHVSGSHFPAQVACTVPLSALSVRHERPKWSAS